MMLLSLPPHDHCKQWGQTGSQTLGRGSWRLGLTPRSSIEGAEGGPPPPPSPVPSQGISAAQGVAPMLRSRGERHRWRRRLGRTLTLAEAGAGPGCGAAKAAGGCAVADHVLLRLEEDDVQLGCEETAEHHRAAEADGHAHGGGLHLRWRVKDESAPKAWAWPQGPLPHQGCRAGSGGDGKHPALGLGPFAKPQRTSRKVEHSRPSSQGDQSSSCG